MGFKSTPQFIGLTREAKPSGKHRANGGDIAWEAGNERASKSDTLDRDLSHLNEYEGYSSGKECWEAICEEADEYRRVYKDKNGKEHSRKLRSDAVVGWAVVIKPPCYMCAVWTPEEVDKFREDMWECLCELEPRLFRNDNIRMKATHRDEGLSHNGLEPHDHIIGVSKDQDGNFCGNLIDPMLYQKVNAELPGMMRNRGWDMDDLDTTDWKAYNNDESYREERTAAVKQKKVEQSQNVNRFIEQRRTAVLTEANAYLDACKTEKERIDEELQEKQKTNKQLDEEIQEKQIKHKHVNRELQQKQEEQKQLEKEIQEKRDNAEKEIQAEKEKQLKTIKDRLLVDYTYSRDLHDEAAEKAIAASEKINSMSTIDAQNEFFAHLKAHKPDLYAELKEADAEYKNGLKEAVMAPEMPPELTNMYVLDEVVKEEHDHLKAVQAEDERDQKLASDLEAENEKLQNRQTVKIEKTVKLVDAEEVQNDANELEHILQKNAVPEKDRSL